MTKNLYLFVLCTFIFYSLARLILSVLLHYDSFAEVDVIKEFKINLMVIMESCKWKKQSVHQRK